MKMFKKEKKIALLELNMNTKKLEKRDYMEIVKTHKKVKKVYKKNNFKMFLKFKKRKSKSLKKHAFLM